MRNCLMSLPRCFLVFLHSIINYLGNIDKGLINGAAFLDLKKAFDSVDHALLLAKLKRYGVKKTSLHWWKSYLHQRKQTCKINNVVSNMQLKFTVVFLRAPTLVHRYLTYTLMIFLTVYKQPRRPCLRILPTFLVRENH